MNQPESSSSRVRRSAHTPAANGSKWIVPGRRWAIYLRDGFACVYCGHIGDLSLDHVVPAERGGNHHASNLVTCCISCNSSKQGISNRKWFARLRERGIDTNKMRHRIARLLRKPLDRKLGRFLASTRKKMTHQVKVPRALIEELVGWVEDSASEHSRSMADAEEVLSEMAVRHGVDPRLLLKQPPLMPNNYEAHEVQQALMKVLPPRYIPPAKVIDDWVGASRVAAKQWADSAYTARISGKPEPEQMPLDLSEYLRWGWIEGQKP